MGRGHSSAWAGLCVTAALAGMSAARAGTPQGEIDSIAEFLLGLGPEPLPLDQDDDGRITVADLVRILFLDVGPATQIRLTTESDTVPAESSFEVFVDLLDDNDRIVNPGTEGSPEGPVELLFSVDGSATVNGGPQQSVQLVLSSPEGARFTVNMNAQEDIAISTQVIAPDPARRLVPPLQEGVRGTVSGRASGMVKVNFGAGFINPDPGQIAVRLERVSSPGGTPLTSFFAPQEFVIDNGAGTWEARGLTPGLYVARFRSLDLSPNGFPYTVGFVPFRIEGNSSTDGLEAFLVEVNPSPSASLVITGEDSGGNPLGALARGLLTTREDAPGIPAGTPMRLRFINGTASVFGLSPGLRYDLSATVPSAEGTAPAESTGAPLTVTTLPGLNQAELRTELTITISEPEPVVRRAAGTFLVPFTPSEPLALPLEVQVRVTDRRGRTEHLIDSPVIAQGDKLFVSIDSLEIQRAFNARFRRGDDVLRFEILGVTSDGQRRLVSKFPTLRVFEDFIRPGPPVRLQVVPEGLVGSPQRELRVRVNVVDANGLIVNRGTPGSEAPVISYDAEVTSGSALINGASQISFGRSVTGILGDSFFLQANATGDATLRVSSANPIAPAETSVFFSVPRTLTGHVTVNGQPAGGSGSVISVYQPGAPDFEFTVGIGAGSDFLLQGLTPDLYLVYSDPQFPHLDIPPLCMEVSLLGAMSANVDFDHVASASTGQISGTVRDRLGVPVTDGLVVARQLVPRLCDTDIAVPAGLEPPVAEAPIAPDGSFTLNQVSGTFALRAASADPGTGDPRTNGFGAEVTVAGAQGVLQDLTVSEVGSLEALFPIRGQRSDRGEVAFVWNVHPATDTPIGQFRHTLRILDQHGNQVRAFGNLSEPFFLWSDESMAPGMYRYTIEASRADGLEELEFENPSQALFEVVDLGGG